MQPFAVGHLRLAPLGLSQRGALASPPARALMDMRHRLPPAACFSNSSRAREIVRSEGGPAGSAGIAAVGGRRRRWWVAVKIAGGGWRAGDRPRRTISRRRPAADGREAPHASVRGGRHLPSRQSLPRAECHCEWVASNRMVPRRVGGGMKGCGWGGARRVAVGWPARGGREAGRHATAASVQGQPRA